MPPTPAKLASAGLIALALTTVACSSSSDDGASRPGRRVLRVQVSDFAIKAPKRIAAGDVVLRVRNAGPDMHELILVRANGARPPLRPDNLTVDEEAIEPRTVSVFEDSHPGTQRLWKVQLAPGRYQLFCNMSGHYLGGMYEELVVQ